MLHHKYICQLHDSPLLFTAPHSKSLVRGGTNHSIEEEVHKKELYTATIVCDLARNVLNSSFIFWGTEEDEKNPDRDPNFMLEEYFPESPFHQALHYWARASREQPLLHVDIHGKADRENDCDIDIGIKCMEVHWKGDNLVKEIRKFFDNFGNIFPDLIIKGHQCKFNAHPARLSGYWGGKEHTMTEQAIKLGIPSFQL